MALIKISKAVNLKFLVTFIQEIACIKIQNCISLKKFFETHMDAIVCVTAKQTKIQVRLLSTKMFSSGFRKWTA